MAKRWLSLMVILTLLSTLFAGAALAQDYDKPTAVKITPSTATTEGRQAVQFSASVSPATASQDVIWSIDVGGNYAAVDQDTGLVTPTGLLPEGKDSVTVTVKAAARADSGVGGTAQLLIREQVPTGVTCDTQLTLPRGESRSFTAIVDPATASNYNLTLKKVNEGDPFTIALQPPVAASGAHTWVITAQDSAALGAYKMKVTADANGAGKEITVNIVAPSATAPDPIFSTDSAIFTQDSDTVTITSPTGANLVVFLDGKKTQDNGSGTYTYQCGNLADNASVAISAQVKAGGNYSMPSQTITKVYTKKLAVKDITFAPASVTIEGTGTAEVSLTTDPEKVAGENLTLTSSDTGVFTVAYDAAAKKATLTGVAAGTAKLTAASADGKTSKSIDVTVTAVAASAVKLYNGQEDVTGKAVTVNQTQYAQLAAKVFGEGDKPASDQAVTWSVEDAKVATVSGGKIVAVAAGTTTVTATEPKSGVKATVTVTVPDAQVTRVATPTFSQPNGATFTAKQLIQVDCATVDATLYYTINGDIPTVSDPVVPAGGVELTGSGAVTLRVLAVKSGLTNTAAEVTYQFKIPLTKVTLPVTQTMQVGQTLQLTPTMTPADAGIKTTVWSVSGVDGQSTSLATIDNKGLLTAKDLPGQVLVSVTMTDINDGTQTANSLVTIQELPVTSVTMLPSAVTLNIGETQQLSYAATREAAKSTLGNWTSSDEKVAIVSNSGLVTAVAAGTATIKVTVDGKEGTALVTVLADPTIIPAKPQTVPAYAATPENQTYNARSGGALSVQVGALTPAQGETLDQLFYYYTLSVTSAQLTGVDPSVNFVVAKDGKVYLNLPDAGDQSLFFSYEIAFTAKQGRGGEDWSGKSIKVEGNYLDITQTPTAINFTPSIVADTTLAGGQTQTLTFGVIANYADFTGLDIPVEATVISGAGVSAQPAIAQDGKVTVTVEGLTKGEYTVQVMLSASGCPDVTTALAKVTVTSDKPVVPVEKKIAVSAASGAYKNAKNVTQLLKQDGEATFTVEGLTAGETVTWSSSKKGYVSINALTGVATLKKTGAATITATISGEGKTSKLTMKVNVIKGSFADPANITLQTKPGKKWEDVTAEGITVVPKKSGAKNVPSRLVSSDGGKIIIEEVTIDTAIATRSGENPAPIKVKKRALTDGKSTTLQIKANGATFTLTIQVDSAAKDLYGEETLAQIQQIIQMEEE